MVPSAHTWYLSIFLHSHILNPGNFTLGKCVNLRQTEPKAVIFSFFWIFFTLSQKIYTHGVPGVPDKYQVWCCIISCDDDAGNLVSNGSADLTLVSTSADQLDHRKCPIEKQFRCVFVLWHNPPHTCWHCTDMFVCWNISLSIVVCCKTAPVSKYAPHSPRPRHILSQKGAATFNNWCVWTSQSFFKKRSKVIKNMWKYNMHGHFGNVLCQSTCEVNKEQAMIW